MMKRSAIWIILSVLGMAGCGLAQGGEGMAAKEGAQPAAAGEMAKDGAAGGQEVATAVFAGGCFWCMEAAFQDVPGVTAAISGYTGGSKQDPTYEEVSSGTTGHAESVEVRYDPSKITYKQLLDIFWHNVDPTDPAGQFCDRGDQYRSEIFYENDQQKQLAEASETEAQKELGGQKIVTKIVPAGKFWPAEEYHQDFYKKNPLRYKFYRAGCGRDNRLHQLWGDKAGGH